MPYDMRNQEYQQFLNDFEKIQKHLKDRQVYLDEYIAYLSGDKHADLAERVEFPDISELVTYQRELQLIQKQQHQLREWLSLIEEQENLPRIEELRHLVQTGTLQDEKQVQLKLKEIANPTVRLILSGLWEYRKHQLHENEIANSTLNLTREKVSAFKDGSPDKLAFIRTWLDNLWTLYGLTYATMQTDKDLRYQWEGLFEQIAGWIPQEQFPNFDSTTYIQSASALQPMPSHYLPEQVKQAARWPTWLALAGVLLVGGLAAFALMTAMNATDQGQSDTEAQAALNQELQTQLDGQNQSLGDVQSQVTALENDLGTLQATLLALDSAGTELGASSSSQITSLQQEVSKLKATAEALSLAMTPTATLQIPNTATPIWTATLDVQATLSALETRVIVIEQAATAQSLTLTALPTETPLTQATQTAETPTVTVIGLAPSPTPQGLDIRITVTTLSEGFEFGQTHVREEPQSKGAALISAPNTFTLIGYILNEEKEIWLCVGDIPRLENRKGWVILDGIESEVNIYQPANSTEITRTTSSTEIEALFNNTPMEEDLCQ
jgi:hypothetical protein